MIANQNFNDILNRVQNSQLNYHLQLSPFYAVISLKRSLIKDRFGHYTLPRTTINSPENENKILQDQKSNLEKDLHNLHVKYESLVIKYESKQRRDHSIHYARFGQRA